MTIEELIDRLPLITGAAFGFGMLLVLVALRFFRRSRRAPYWTQRRQAGQRGFRILLFSMFFFTASALLCILTFADNYIEGDEPTTVAENATQTSVDITLSVTVEDQTSETATDTVETELTSTFTDEPTDPATDTIEPSAGPETELPQVTKLPTEVPPTATRLTITSTNIPPTETEVPPTATDVPPTATNTNMPTVTNTATTEPTPTSTPTATTQPTSAVVIATVVGSQTPRDNASLSIVSLSNRISNDLKPTNEGTEFDAGFRRLYFMLDFDNMDNGVRWRRELYHNGMLVGGREDLWGTQSTGQALFFVSLADGFGSGEYEIRVYVETDLQDEMDFTVN